MLAVSAGDYEITTVEGLADDDGSLSPVQQAFKECHGLQCGFCTPGFLTTITAGLEENPSPTAEEAREMIAGNLCRCTGYQNIVAAVLRAAELVSTSSTTGDGSSTTGDGSSTTGDGSSTTEDSP
jgi:carbon-monoxide dehydrogenase small subunit